MNTDTQLQQDAVADPEGGPSIQSAERTDADIATSAQNVLDWTTCLPAGSVKVSVAAGRVTLSGEVGWQYQRQAAGDAVRHLTGVTGVSNQIATKLRVSISAVKSDIEAALKQRAAADATTISVDVHGADVTLTGTVHSWAARDLATHSALRTPGVGNVFDKLTVVD